MDLYFLLVWLFWHVPGSATKNCKSCSPDYVNAPIRVKG